MVFRYVECLLHSPRREEMNLSRPAFRSLCRSLCVPLLTIGTSTLILLDAFRVGLTFVSRWGQPDFVVGESKIDVGQLRAGLSECIEDMMRLRQMDGFEVGDEVGRLAREAAERMIRAYDDHHP